MKNNYYHVDTFTNQLFCGNPAAVCILTDSLSEEHMRAIAIENQLPVTAFIKQEGELFSIRWITPESELPLCGHGTLAAAWVLFHELDSHRDELQFDSPTAGILSVRRTIDGPELNFPIQSFQPVITPHTLQEGLGMDIMESYQAGDRILVLLQHESMIKALRPNLDILKRLDYRGIVVSAPGDTVDFVSRTFYPRKITPEDAVTGASHCVLVPYWAQRLGKTHFHAYQLSARGGELLCSLSENRVLLRGTAVTYLKGRALFKMAD